MITFFTAWGYDVTYLEFVAALTSAIGVWYGTTTKRVTWPWWIISSALYGIFFWQVDLVASALLQLVFIAAGIWGWFGWGPKGAKPGRLSNRDRALWLLALVVSWFAFTPWLHHIGAAAYKTDALIFLGSVIAQIIMVYERYENWPLWFAVDALATVEYAVLNYWFTALLYLAFTGIAVVGWVRWLRIHKSSL